MAVPRPALAVTWTGLCVNALLGAGKVVLGLLGGSQALVADGLHSLSDLATDLATLFGLHMQAVPRDLNHPYGHHRFASMATLAIGATLVGSALFIAGGSLLALGRDEQAVPALFTVVAAAVSLVIKEALYWGTRAVARRLRSELLRANAWHHRTDSLSSLLVLVALVGARLLGPTGAYLDAAVGFLLGAFLALEGVRIFRRAFAELVDTAPARAILDDLREHILPTEGVQAYHDFRARRVGDCYEVDVHVQVDPQLTVQAGHDIADVVKKNLLARHPEVQTCLVHVEPATPRHLVEVGLSEAEDVHGPLPPRFRGQ